MVTRKTAVHVSLSSIFNCQKTDDTKAVTKSNRQAIKPGNQSASQPISLDFSRTKDFVASSAAALVSERGYRFHTANSQQPIPIFLQKSNIQLKSNTNSKIKTVADETIARKHPIDP